MTDLTKLATLKDMLESATDFAKVSAYFFDHFGGDPDFLSLGTPTRHPLLEAVVAQAGPQMFGPDAEQAQLMLTRLEEHQFVHGGVHSGLQLGNIIYFEDAGIGLITITMPPPSTETKFARFRGQRLRRPAEPSAN